MIVLDMGTPEQAELAQEVLGVVGYDADRLNGQFLAYDEGNRLRAAKAAMELVLAGKELTVVNERR